MFPIKFELTPYQLKCLNENYPLVGKNSDIGKKAIQIVIWYFEKKYNTPLFKIGGRNEPDLIVIVNGESYEYEVKGTEDNKVAFQKLKVSSKFCHDKLISGMELIRVTSIGSQTVDLYFLRHDIHFTLKSEVRWTVIKK